MLSKKRTRPRPHPELAVQAVSIAASPMRITANISRTLRVVKLIRLNFIELCGVVQRQGGTSGDTSRTREGASVVRVFARS